MFFMHHSRQPFHSPLDDKDTIKFKTQLLLFPGIIGDSGHPERRGRFTEFLTKLEELRDGKMMNVLFVLDDPAGNSYIQVRNSCWGMNDREEWHARDRALVVTHIHSFVALCKM